MAQRKKGKAKGKAKSAPKRSTAKKTSRRPARRAAAATGGADRRVAALEAENRRLREEIADLRGRLEQQERAVPAFNLTAGEASDQS
jgi:hypothetical protein